MTTTSGRGRARIRHLTCVKLAGLLMVLALLPLWPASAFAHAEYKSSEPKKGARLNTPPGHLFINFTEPPTADARLTVLDGCGTDVVDSVEAQQLALHAVLSEGQPGRWRVEYHVISGLDGHPTEGSFGFTVTGAKDCGGEPSPTTPGDADEESDGNPVVIIAMLVGLGALGGIVLFVVTRRA